MPLLQDNQKPIDLINRLDPEKILTECGCIEDFNRKTPENLRDEIDSCVVRIFDNLSWPKKRIIEVVDSMSGGLLQTATVLISLVNAGYQVSCTLIDQYYLLHDKSEKIANLNIKFEEIARSINKMTKNPSSIRLKGIFSSVDNYVATVRGIKPVQHVCVSSRHEFEEALKNQSRRYVTLAPRRGLFGRQIDENKYFATEFLAAERYRGTLPDLVLTIDDLLELEPRNLQEEHKLQFVYALSKDKNNFMYHNEVVDPIRKLNRHAIFLATKKQGMDRPELLLLQGEEAILFDEEEKLAPHEASPDFREDKTAVIEEPHEIDKLTQLVIDFYTYCTHLPDTTMNKQQILMNANTMHVNVDITQNECMRVFKQTLSDTRGLIQHRNPALIRCFAAIANAFIYMSRTLATTLSPGCNTNSFRFFDVYQTKRDRLLDNIENELTFIREIPIALNM